MAKTTVQSKNIEIHQQMTENLKSLGMDSKDLDRIISQRTLDAVLADRPAVNQYFRLAAAGLKNLCEWDWENRVVSGAIDGPSSYKYYYGKDFDTSKLIALFDYIPLPYIRDSKQLGMHAGFNQQETLAVHHLVNYGGSPGNYPSDSGNQGYPSPGGSPGGSGKAMAVGPSGGSPSGGTKSLGGPPPPPPGAGYGPPPPPPPMGGGYGGGGTDYYNQNYTSAEQAWIEANIQGAAGAGWFPSLLFSENQKRGIAAAGMAEFERIREAKMRILTEMQGLGDRPEDMRRITILQQQLSMIGTDEQQITDKMMRATHAADELKTLIKGLIDKENEDRYRMISNIGK